MTDDERRKLLSTETSLAMSDEPRLPAPSPGFENFSLSRDDDRSPPATKIWTPTASSTCPMQMKTTKTTTEAMAQASGAPSWSPMPIASTRRKWLPPCCARRHPGGRPDPLNHNASRWPGWRLAACGWSCRPRAGTRALALLASTPLPRARMTLGRVLLFVVLFWWCGPPDDERALSAAPEEARAAATADLSGSDRSDQIDRQIYFISR